MTAVVAEPPQKIPRFYRKRYGTKYRPKFDKLIIGMAAEGMPLIQIAQSLEISKKTLRHWLDENPLLDEAVHDAWELHRRPLVDAMIKRALGFKSEERTVEYDPPEEEGQEPQKVAKVVVKTKHVAGNVDAQKFLLTNFFPDEFKNRQEVNTTGKTGLKVYVGFTPDDWDKEFPEQPMRNVTDTAPKLPAEVQPKSVFEDEE